MKNIKVIQVGIGSIGRKIVEQITTRKGIELVDAMDVNPKIVGKKNTQDTIEIKGVPDITSQIHGGINGDFATCSVTVNAIKSILKAKPGLRVITDIPAISYFAA